jgi:hypothetical protein
MPSTVQRRPMSSGPRSPVAWVALIVHSIASPSGRDQKSPVGSSTRSGYRCLPRSK